MKTNKRAKAVKSKLAGEREKEEHKPIFKEKEQQRRHEEDNTTRARTVSYHDWRTLELFVSFSSFYHPRPGCCSCCSCCCSCLTRDEKRETRKRRFQNKHRQRRHTQTQHNLLPTRCLCPPSLAATATAVAAAVPTACPCMNKNNKFRPPTDLLPFFPPLSL